MINRQTIYSALFKLKNAGVKIDEQLQIMANNPGVPRQVLEFLQNNSPQFQFYRYIKKYQKALSESILDYDTLTNDEKMITASSFITRVYLALKYKNLDKSLIDDLHVIEITDALHTAALLEKYEDLDNVMKLHQESLRLFYKNLKVKKAE